MELIISSIFLAVGSGLALFSRLPKETVDQQSKLISALEGRIDTMEKENKTLLSKHIENGKAIAALEGQIKVYKELPLQEIAQSLKALENIPSEFERISRGNTDQILHTIQHVNVQNVKTQTVEHEQHLTAKE